MKSPTSLIIRAIHDLKGAILPSGKNSETCQAVQLIKITINQCYQYVEMWALLGKCEPGQPCGGGGICTNITLLYVCHLTQ